ncbi:DUF3343 domain-containing protein [Paenibacillus sp. F411]|uniref:Putative Se/S carrier protein-like domain-containing protein n=1 Tax=Paenibacillus algicola TaxID=2565926 RepID=A0A4P8XVH9_9BACL|nr:MULTISPECIES: DUF3343 domain-containing protein [Paenibacillus]MBO2944484.1 DUF3343 domain-containing protein [Paenibacillus sp. F411]QCT04899.1 hypothetical protein E6C60_4194 [Paenibacillus algicola]
MEGLLIIAFDSTQQALRTEMLLEYKDIDMDIFPTPKEITAGCALSIQFPETELEEVQSIIVSEQVEIRGIFKPLSNGGYSSI